MSLRRAFDVRLGDFSRPAQLFQFLSALLAQLFQRLLPFIFVGAQRLNDGLGDGEVAEPFMVGGDDVPGGVLGGGVRQGVGVGRLVLLPELPLLPVAGG